MTTLPRSASASAPAGRHMRRYRAITLPALVLLACALAVHPAAVGSGAALAQDGAADGEPPMPSFNPGGAAGATDEADTTDEADATEEGDTAALPDYAQGLADPAAGYMLHTWGAPDAPVTLMEFSSYTCGHCAAFHTDTLPTLKQRYIDTGQVRLVLVDTPLDILAARVSMITHCAPEPMGRKLVDIFYADQGEWLHRDAMEAVTGMARLAGMSEAEVNACLTDDALYEAITRARDEAGKRWSINATPSFVINGERFQGSRRLDEMTAALDAALEQAGDAPAAD